MSLTYLDSSYIAEHHKTIFNDQFSLVLLNDFACVWVYLDVLLLDLEDTRTLFKLNLFGVIAFGQVLSDVFFQHFVEAWGHIQLAKLVDIVYILTEVDQTLQNLDFTQGIWFWEDS